MTPHRSRRPSTRPLRGVVSAVLAAAVAVVTLLVPTPPPAEAADLRLFEPGHIISDAVFFDGTTMSAAQIDGFLDTKGASCVAGEQPCLKDYVETTRDRAADSYCAAYVGAANETAGQILEKVARACRINPQVLLVTLQKEQGLVTANRPTTYKYQRAMGFGCPDTAPCNTEYFGFWNQVYRAARQFQVYTARPTSYNYRAGAVNTIKFHPNAACGSTSVYIENQATANLYIYTPYTPNAAALAAGYSTGDSCSSYGNRNFWNYFRDWFGATTDRVPTGAIDTVTTTDRSVTVTGWALDRDTTAPIAVHVYAGNRAAAVTADGHRPDVDAAFGRGAAHGYTATVETGPGRHEVCVYALNDAPKGNPTTLGCRTVDVVNRAPRGLLEVVEGAGGAVEVSGWAFDPDTAGAVAVEVVVDGTATTLTTDRARPDVAEAAGRSAGFLGWVAVPEGNHTVCARVRDTATGAPVELGCRPITTGAVRSTASGTGIVTLVPTRLQDTWQGSAAGSVRCVPVVNAGVPATATGVLLNVAAAGPTAPGNVVAFPHDGSASPRPPVGATVNFEPGAEVANAAWVKVGANGRVCWAVQGGGSARVVVDVMGYTTASAGVVTQASQRLVDTRAGSQVGEIRSALPARTVVEVKVTGVAGVPADATAVVLNAAVVNPPALGHLKIYPAQAGGAIPGTSTVNFAPGQTKSTATVVPVGRDGRISLYAETDAAVRTEVVLDVTGYVAAGSTAYHATAPTRLLDTRPAAPAPQRLVPTLTTGVAASVDVRTGGTVPAGATAVILAVTAVHPTSPGNLKVYPDTAGGAQTPRPGASVINYVPGRDIPNLVVVGVPPNGRVALYSEQFAGGRTDVTLDVVGYVTN